MTRNKRKARDRAEVLGDGPTPERLARDEWQTIAAPKLQDEDWRDRTGKARRVACRITRMRRDGWISDDGHRALLAYQALIERAGYDHGRSCIDFSPRGSGMGLPPAVTMARDKLAAIEFGLSMEIGQAGVRLVTAVLGPYGMETIGDVAERIRPGGSRDGRIGWARDVFTGAGVYLAGLSA